MSFPDVLRRGDDFLTEMPRSSVWWNYASHATCLMMTTGTKIVLNTLYRPYLHGVDKLDDALARARQENRSLLTVMNHMSVVDDPTFYAALPWRFHTDIDTIRWGFGAHNICFSSTPLLWFFNLGKILGTKRFGFGPFQPSLDAAIRIMSPDDTLDLEFLPLVREEQKPVLIQKASLLWNCPSENPDVSLLVSHKKTGANILMAQSPFVRKKTSWFHVFPEGFVLQLEPPHENSMRYFKWGVSRLILEATVAPIVVPIFTYGLEKIAPEDSADKGLNRWLPSNIGAEVHIHIGDALPDEQIENYREVWRDLCERYVDPKSPHDLNDELRNGAKTLELRSQIAADLRTAVANIRSAIGVFNLEDVRFKDPDFWKRYTLTEGSSDPDVKFVGKNWAIKRLQKHLPEYSEAE